MMMQQQALNNKLQTASTKHQAPNNKHQTPSTKHQAPNKKYQTTSTKQRAPNTKHQTKSTKHQAPSTKQQAPSTKQQEPNTKNQRTNWSKSACCTWMPRQLLTGYTYSDLITTFFDGLVAGTWRPLRRYSTSTNTGGGKTISSTLIIRLKQQQNDYYTW